MPFYILTHLMPINREKDSVVGAEKNIIPLACRISNDWKNRQRAVELFLCTVFSVICPLIVP